MDALHSAELTPVRAFVVQVRVGTPLVAGQLQGRIEHVASGRAVDFASLGQAFDFMRLVLDDLSSEGR